MRSAGLGSGALAGIARVRSVSGGTPRPHLGSPLVNCYYYAPHNHCLLIDHLDEDLKKIAGLGSDAVSLCVEESRLANYLQQRLHNAVDQAHACGLKVFAVPNRWGGLVAGWIPSFDVFMLENPDTWVRDKQGIRNGRFCCSQNPKLQQHYRDTLKRMMSEYEFDGAVWDEPRNGGACFCEFCLDASGGEPTADWQHDQTARFLDEMSGFIKSVRPRALVSVFSMPWHTVLIRALTQTKNIDFIGTDGHLRSPDHKMHVMKKTIFEAHRDYSQLIKDSGHKTMFLIEGQRHQDADLENYLKNVEAAFALPMDQVMYYFSAHEMTPAKEAIFNKATWKAVSKLKARRAR